MATETTTQHVAWIVQFWVERYEFWSDCREPSESLFTPAQVGYPNREDGVSKLAAMREANPTGTYRLIRVTTTTEVMA